MLLIASPLTTTSAHATDGDRSGPAPLKSLSLEQLGEVEVTTATKGPEQVWRTPAAIYVLTQEDIRPSGATSIPEVLRLVPGVEVSRVSSSVWAVGIRGFGSGFSKSVLVLIDGRSVYTPLFAGVEWNVQNLLVEDVERIEVIRGPGGTIWGSNAVNGVINIITKSATETHGGLAAASGGTSDQGAGAVRWAEAVEAISIIAFMPWDSGEHRATTWIEMNTTIGKWDKPAFVQIRVLRRVTR